jgi:hypothetical protein
MINPNINIGLADINKFPGITSNIVYRADEGSRLGEYFYLTL